MKTLITAIWVDPMGSMSETAEEQIKAAQEHYEEELGVKLDVHTPLNVGQIQISTDLVLFDFGGMMMGNSLAEDNSRRLIRWAEDNPSALVVIISTFTFDNAFRHAMEDHLNEAVPYHYNRPEGRRHSTPIHNIVVEQWTEEFIPKWFRDAHGCTPDHREVKELIPPTEVEEQESNAKFDAELERGREERIAATIANLQKKGVELAMNVGFLPGVLPSQKFFEPKPKFIAHMKKHYRKWKVYDVGCGVGHVTAALHKAGLKSVKALDTLKRDSQEAKVEFGDGTTYPYKSGSVVMFCRPCHGWFVEPAISHAIRCDAGAILYVGLSKNVKDDLGRYYRKFKRVLTNVGKDKENLWVMKGTK